MTLLFLCIVVRWHILVDCNPHQCAQLKNIDYHSNTQHYIHFNIIDYHWVSCFVKIAGCWWTAVHNNKHNSAILIIILMSLITVLDLLLHRVCCFSGFGPYSEFGSLFCEACWMLVDCNTQQYTQLNNVYYC